MKKEWQEAVIVECDLANTEYGNVIRRNYDSVVYDTNLEFRSFS